MTSRIKKSEFDDIQKSFPKFNEPFMQFNDNFVDLNSRAQMNW